MGLTIGGGPFGHRDGQFDFGPLPEHVRYWEPWPRRMRAILGGETILDSKAGMLLQESGEFSTLYFPLSDFRAGTLEAIPSGEGSGRRWSVRLGERRVLECVASSPTHSNGVELMRGYATLEFASVDRWFEEDDPIYAHPRDPYHRVDVLSSSRHVVVRRGATVVAETRRPKLLFETSLPVRYYIPFDDMRIDLLLKSATVSECPYKGDGQHWT